MKEIDFMATDIVGDLVELLFWGGFYIASNRGKRSKPVKPVEPIYIKEDSSPKTPLERYSSSISDIDFYANLVAPFCYFNLALFPAVDFFASHGKSSFEGLLLGLFTAVFIPTEVFLLIILYTLKRKFFAEASPEEIALFDNNKRKRARNVALHILAIILIDILILVICSLVTFVY